MDGKEELIETTSADGRRMFINRGALQAAVREADDSPERETGGVLVGRFHVTDGAPILYKCLLPPQDSESERAEFVRGAAGLRELLADEFARGYQYLGEWHTHPNGPPRASWRDRLTMSRIAFSRRYQMADPVLLILAGSPSKGWTVAPYRVHRRSCLVEYETFEAVEALDEISR